MALVDILPVLSADPEQDYDIYLSVHYRKALAGITLGHDPLDPPLPYDVWYESWLATHEVIDWEARQHLDR